MEEGDLFPSAVLLLLAIQTMAGWRSSASHGSTCSPSRDAGSEMGYVMTGDGSSQADGDGGANRHRIDCRSRAESRFRSDESNSAA